MNSQTTDHRLLIDQAYRLRDKLPGIAAAGCARRENLEALGYLSTAPGPSIVLAEDTSCELGAPDTLSLSLLLVTQQPGQVRNGVWICDHRTPDDNHCTSYLQVIVTELNHTNADREFRLQSLRNAANRMPGLMIRSVGARSWVRISRGLAARGFNLTALGNLLWQTCVDVLDAPCSVILAAQVPLTTLAPFEDLARAAQALSAKRKQLQLAADGIIGCDELDCTTCDEKPACDIIKNVANPRSVT